MKRWVYLSLISLLCACEKKQVIPPVPTPVTAIRVVPQTIPANFEFVAVAESSHIVELRARVEGYLEKIAYVEGSLVKTGDLMFVLDQRPFQAEVDKMAAELAQQKAILWNAIQIKNRMVPLYKQNAVSQRDLDNALSDEMASEANVLAAQAALLKSQINLGFASISAPVTGMASRAIFREGALISPGPNSLLTNIFVIDPIWVNFSVSENDILKARDELKKGLLKYPEGNNFNIKVVMADGSTMPAKGKIDFLDPAVQQTTGTTLVRSIMDNPQGWLRPGQFVRVIVEGAYHPNAIVVPQTAVLQGQGGLFVYVVGAQGKIEIRPVILGDWYLNGWIINSGVEKGDIVVVGGVNRITNGSIVEVKTWVTE
ncbi:MAG: efflux RND transporter periplasmic adaptor subunit [Simkaniaceae bacterium]|nr:efflux RND transporter periplasmic adaptor subunit [Simkaniaceae bacterium]